MLKPLREEQPLAALDPARGIMRECGRDEPSAFRLLQKLAVAKRKALREWAGAVLLTE